MAYKVFVDRAALFRCSSLERAQQLAEAFAAEGATVRVSSHLTEDTETWLYDAAKGQWKAVSDAPQGTSRIQKDCRSTLAPAEATRER